MAYRFLDVVFGGKLLGTRKREIWKIELEYVYTGLNENTLA